jgi:Phytochelatin synthase
MGLLPALVVTALPGCRTQDEPAFCGLASLAMVLNALSIGEIPAVAGSWWTQDGMSCALGSRSCAPGC